MLDQKTVPTEVFVIPITEQCDLLYAPLHQFSALVNPQATRQLQQTISNGAPYAEALQPILTSLHAVSLAPIPVRSGPLNDPYFLGLIPTRGCNLACRYCDFEPPEKDGRVMSLSVVRGAIDAYLHLLFDSARTRGEIHFFGGEPFHTRQPVIAAVEYASLRAAELGLTIRFEATTNGIYDPAFCQWIADHFDAVVLSLDGPADIQNLHRPARDGSPSSAIVERSAAIFSQSNLELVVRACISGATASRMPEIAAWVADNFSPTALCFEPLQPTLGSAAAGLLPPDPWDFAENFVQACRLLDERGIEAVYSMADISQIRSSFCPLGKDALIVGPDGMISACYLLPSAWEEQGLDLVIGRLAPDGLDLDPAAVQRVRLLAGREKPLCAGCLCLYHYAGGCHVHHSTNPGKYDNACIQARTITIARLLHGLGQPALAAAWLSDRPRLQRSILQPSDRLFQQN